MSRLDPRDSHLCREQPYRFSQHGEQIVSPHERCVVEDNSHVSLFDLNFINSVFTLWKPYVYFYRHSIFSVSFQFIATSCGPELSSLLVGCFYSSSRQNIKQLNKNPPLSSKYSLSNHFMEGPPGSC